MSALHFRSLLTHSSHTDATLPDVEPLCWREDVVCGGGGDERGLVPVGITECIHAYIIYPPEWFPLQSFMYRNKFHSP